MRELQRNAQSQRAQREMFTALPNDLVAQGKLTGHPVHFVDGKWYVEITPSGSIPKSELFGVFKIQEQLEDGFTKRDPTARRIQVWEGGHWLEFHEQGLMELGLDFVGDRLPPTAIQALKEWQEERDEEDERLALRQLLAESQQEGYEDETG